MYLFYVLLTLLMDLVLEIDGLLLEQLFDFGVFLGDEGLKFVFPLLLCLVGISLCLQGVGCGESGNYSLRHFLLRLFSLLAVVQLKLKKFILLL